MQPRSYKDAVVTDKWRVICASCEYAGPYGMAFLADRRLRREDVSSTHVNRVVGSFKWDYGTMEYVIRGRQLEDEVAIWQSVGLSLAIMEMAEVCEKEMRKRLLEEVEGQFQTLKLQENIAVSEELGVQAERPQTPSASTYGSV